MSAITSQSSHSQRSESYYAPPPPYPTPFRPVDYQQSQHVATRWEAGSSMVRPKSPADGITFSPSVASSDLKLRMILPEGDCGDGIPHVRSVCDEEELRERQAVFQAPDMAWPGSGAASKVVSWQERHEPELTNGRERKDYEQRVQSYLEPYQSVVITQGRELYDHDLPRQQYEGRYNGRGEGRRYGDRAAAARCAHCSHEVCDSEEEYDNRRDQHRRERMLPQERRRDDKRDEVKENDFLGTCMDHGTKLAKGLGEHLLYELSLQMMRKQLIRTVRKKAMQRLVEHIL